MAKKKYLAIQISSPAFRMCERCKQKPALRQQGLDDLQQIVLRCACTEERPLDVTIVLSNEWNDAFPL